MVNVAALQILDLDFAFTRPGREIRDVALEIGEAFLVRITHDGHDQPPFGADGNADVVIIVQNEIVAFDSSVNRRHGLKRFHRRFNEKGHESEFDAVFSS